jgi:hypothetical protein
MIDTKTKKSLDFASFDEIFATDCNLRQPVRLKLRRITIGNGGKNVHSHREFVGWRDFLTLKRMGGGRFVRH